MPLSQPVIIDTNIIFSALLSNQSSFTQIILNSEYSFYICESVIIELFKHKEKIISLSKLSEEEIIRLYSILLRRVIISKEKLIEPSIRQKAYHLCLDIDEADSPIVALTIKLKGLL